MGNWSHWGFNRQIQTPALPRGAQPSKEPWVGGPNLVGTEGFIQSIQIEGVAGDSTTTCTQPLLTPVAWI